MLVEKRFQMILEMVEKYSTVTVAQLCEAMGVSEATIRRDLNTLDQQGKLVKVHGGAMAMEEATQFEPDEPDFITKEKLHVEEKDKIARFASSQIHDDDFVFLDAGTTILRMVDYLGKSKATFVTTGITCARRLVNNGLRAYVVGGLLKPGTEAIVGSAALESLGRYNFTKAFLGVNGITVRQGMTTPDMEEARIKEKAVKQSYMTYVLADSSKFGKVSAVTFCQMNQACIITDNLPEESYRQHGMIKEVEGIE